MKVVLIGNRGTGKSTIGKLVAESLGLSFHDLDKEVESSSGKPIVQLFAENGENHFRKLESEALNKLLKESNGVIALGGGTLDSETNRTVVRMSGSKVVWLRCSEQARSKRLESCTRPKVNDNPFTRNMIFALMADEAVLADGEIGEVANGVASIYRQVESDGG